MQWLGIDVGGTFTDFVLYDEGTDQLRIGKTSSTPPDYSAGMLAGLDRLGLDLKQIHKLVHGTTIATNTILERSGAVTAVITTRGFRDVLEVGRGDRVLQSNLFNIKAVRPQPLVPRSRRFEVDERTLVDGTILREVRVEEIEAVLQMIRSRGVEAIAVCFLHAYANDTNERIAKETIQKSAPGLFISTSSEVLPEFREYERFSTTVLNVYVAPRVGRYLTSLQAQLAARGYAGEVAIMTSSGGTMSIGTAAQFPGHSILSGPAAGVTGALFVAKAAGYRNLITYDMGGTSTDVCLVKELAVSMITEGKIGPFPNKVPQIEINSVGAGGGSLAWVEAGQFLSVGPQSAGAMPGPACYGRGGTEPTVTDANLLLGRLNPKVALGREIPLDMELARKAIERLARHFPDLSLLTMAEGIIKLAVAKMTGAIKELSVMRGHDPRDFVLVAYGGAGPMHAALIARELGISRILIPAFPGNFSAFGLLVTDVRHDYVRTRLVNTKDLTLEDFQALFAGMRDEARARLYAEGFRDASIRFEAQLDMRYAGQAFELSVPFEERFASMADVDTAFYLVHERRYGHSVKEAVEIVNCRLSAYGIVPKPRPSPPSGAGKTLAEARLEERQVYLDGAFVPTPIYAREGIPPGSRLRGPAIVEELGATTVVTPEFTGWVDAWGNLILERN